MPGKLISTSRGRAQAFPDDAFHFERASLKRPPPPSVLTAELLRVEKTLDHNAADVLDRRNLPLDR
jgi:hypothetical protein